MLAKLDGICDDLGEQVSLKKLQLNRNVILILQHDEDLILLDETLNFIQLSLENFDTIPKNMIEKRERKLIDNLRFFFEEYLRNDEIFCLQQKMLN